MKRPLVLSGGVAFGLHALFLFGVSSPLRVAKTKPPVDDTTYITVLPAPIEEDPPENAAEASGSAGPPVPASIDLPDVARPDSFRVEIERSQPVSLHPNIDRVPTTFTGDLGAGDTGPSRGNGPLIIGSNFLDGPPVARSQPPPVYPFEHRRLGTRGEVVVAFSVDESGRAFAPRIVSSTAREFEDPTLRAVERWKFQPGTKDGKKVRFSMVVPVLFNITPE